MISYKSRSWQISNPQINYFLSNKKVRRWGIWIWDSDLENTGKNHRRRGCQANLVLLIDGITNPRFSKLLNLSLARVQQAFTRQATRIKTYAIRWSGQAKTCITAKVQSDMVHRKSELSIGIANLQLAEGSSNFFGEENLSWGRQKPENQHSLVLG